MNRTQAAKAPEAASLDAPHATDAYLSFQRASILFVASLGSFIGASLLLASF